MKKKVLAITTAAVLIAGAATVVYAKGSIGTNNTGFRGSMMSQYNINGNADYNSMIDLMNKNGFAAGAKAMENRDYNAMNSFMNSLTDEQYNQMINIMKNNGYEGMAKMMSTVNRQQMVNIHSSMMGQ